MGCITRAVANGPVGPAMAGPIIESANLIYFLIFLHFLLYCFGRNNNWAGIFFRYYFWNRDDTVAKICTLAIRFYRFSPSHAGSHHHSMGAKGAQLGARVRWPLQRPSMLGRNYHGGSYICMCSSDWTYLWTSFADSATSFADSATM